MADEPPEQDDPLDDFMTEDNSVELDEDGNPLDPDDDYEPPPPPAPVVCKVCGKAQPTYRELAAELPTTTVGTLPTVRSPSEGWIRNRVEDSPDFRWQYEHFCPEHSAGRCRHGIHAKGGKSRHQLGSFLVGHELVVNVDDGRPTLVCGQCEAVWVCTPADVLLGDQLPHDVIVDMINLGRWDEAIALFYELFNFAQDARLRQAAFEKQELVGLLTGMLSTSWQRPSESKVRRLLGLLLPPDSPGSPGKEGI